MSHFFGEIQGNRGSTSRGGSRSSGIWAHVRGWNVGCKIVCGINKEGLDEIVIYKTGGSNGMFTEEIIAVINEEEKESSKECN